MMQQFEDQSEYRAKEIDGFPHPVEPPQLVLQEGDREDL
jgi:hypothetical protein